ncbi:carbonyl reductase [NADPH] 1 [Aplysia californica]|uniref:carbonyl reductase (NADPH) n=1 Tax=Aplysia californica TaxID=6500 RepID=A0ABM0JK42_APLCA|nr:carbonyl reductase [NADPH] 1 [Aplysia californica]
MARRVAVVTGSNKGVGFGIVRALCQKFDGDVILTARDEGRGKQAVDALKQERLSPLFHQLDITDHNSVVRLRDFLKEKYGGLDVLVNNAAISYTGSSTAPVSEQAKVTLKTNFDATLDVCEVLFPLLRPHARVSNVSSFVSQMSLAKCSDALRSKFTNPNLRMDELVSLLKQFVKSAQTDQHQAQGFSNSSYAMSKVGVTVMSIIQQRELDAKGAEDIVVNACCPGYVDTDMSSHRGPLTIDQGAVTPTYCALLPQNVHSPRGKFIRNKKIAQWKM